MKSLIKGGGVVNIHLIWLYVYVYSTNCIKYYFYPYSTAMPKEFKVRKIPSTLLFFSERWVMQINRTITLR